ncbi:substrate-binding domain-containing protein [Microbacterium sp.]|uniref:substrate-binding domain-containing protein n=1 Tax=Microbacterium sp. TaxID=51671 RepID=UPI00391BE350
MPRPRTLRLALAVLAVAVSVTGCTSSRGTATVSSDGAGVIGVSLPSTADAGWERGGNALAQELTARGYRVDLQFAASDARTQDAQVRNMVTKGADAVIVAPVASAELSTALGAAVDEGVPVVQFGRALPELPAGGAFAADPSELGRVQAEALLADLAEATPTAPSTAGAFSTPGPASQGPDAAVSDSAVPNSAVPDSAVPDSAVPDSAVPDPAAAGEGVVRLAVLAGVPSDAWGAERYTAALEALEPAVAAGTIEIVSGATLESAALGQDTAEQRAEAAEKRVRELRAGAPEEAPTAVLALDDAVTRGVVTALTTDPPVEETAPPSASPSASSTASPSPPPTGAVDPTTEAAPAVLVVGSGADPLTVRALRDGDIDATAFADPRALVAATADAVESLLAGRAVADDGESPLPGTAGASVSPSMLRADDVEELVASGWVSTAEL